MVSTVLFKVGREEEEVAEGSLQYNLLCLYFAEHAKCEGHGPRSGARVAVEIHSTRTASPTSLFLQFLVR